MEGSGTATDPFQITNCSELQAINNNLASHYILVNDIDCSDTVNWNNGAGFNPIGDLYWYHFPFTSSFDGQNYKITNLYINRPSRYRVGLFGYISSAAQIKNVSLINVNISGMSSVGGLVGLNGGQVANSYSTRYVSGTQYVGGLVGDTAYYASVTSSYYNKETSGQNDTGKGEPKTTEEMMEQETYQDWDFVNIWWMPVNDYPKLRAINPPPYAIENFPEVIKDLNLPQGTKNSLISMIDNAKEALDKGNEETAVNILQAFINYVEAQSEKKISEENAEMLIEYAENVIDQIEES